MNYYVSNTVFSIEPEINTYIVKTQFMDYKGFSDNKHDELLRCQECGIKYDTYLLKRIAVGKFVCKYCLNKKETV